MSSDPTRSDVLSEELVARGQELRARRAESTAGAEVLAALDGASLESRRADVRRARADVDAATIDRLRRS